MPQGRKVWLQRTVYSTIAAATLVLGFLVFDEIKYNSATNSLQQPIAQIEMSVVEKPAQSIATPQTIEPKTEPQQEQIQETVTETASYLASKFYVIGGAFSSVKNANIFAKQLEEKGYKAEVLHNEKGLTRVAYIVEADSLSADAQLQKIKQEENQAAWLLKW
ncbi:MAG: SPOR domain-containing protein [Sphingobacteriales bacterium]|nr:MAG: SPOR domain-containing protein [Sphingobacteriales bacterium]